MVPLLSRRAAFEVGRDQEGELPLGGPTAGAVLSVRDAAGDPVADGELGELWIGGPGVTRGYLGRESSAFRTEPDGSRVYRSGDLVRLADGELRYAGRADDQVKIRGFRIEPGEIEAVLTAHESVGQVAVVVREDQPGVKRLVAYVVPAAGDLDPEALRSLAADELPDYLSIPLLAASVLQGSVTAVEILQVALGVHADGGIGPQTISAARMANPPSLLPRFVAEQVRHLRKDATWDVDGIGWVERCVESILQSATIMT